MNKAKYRNMSVAKEDLELSQTIRNIVREIRREFTRLHLEQADDTLITFYVKLLLYDPKWHIDGHVLLAREKIQKLINRVVNDFRNRKQPDMITINIQNCLFNTFQRRYEILDSRKLNTVKKLVPLKLAILEQDTTTGDLTNVFHRIVVYFILLSGMGNPLESEVYKQSSLVLKSILNMDELREFLNLPYVIRLYEFDTMLKVYMGIRIYNKYCEKGGDGVPDLPKLLSTSLDGLNDFLLYLFYETNEKIEILTDALTNCYIPLVWKHKVYLKLNLPENECLFEEDIEYSQHLMLVYKQFQEVIQFLIEEVISLERIFKKAENDFQETIEHLQATVVPNFHVHVSLVFPCFQKLSDVWTNYQDMIFLVNVIRQVVQNIDKMVKSLKFYNNLVRYYFNVFPRRETYHEEDLGLQRILDDPDSRCEVYKLEDLKTTSTKIVFQYEEHCSWTLVMTHGLLVKGDPEYGVVRFNGRYYLFSSTLALKCFTCNPTYFIDHVLQMARTRPGFIHFLKLNEDLTYVQDRTSLVETDAGDSQVIYAEVACQVEWQGESWIDRKYHSSLWEYKNDALRMASLSKTKTVSTMTDKTFFKNSMNTQTYEERDKEIVTNKDNYTNTPTPLAFLQGLRGDKDGKKQAQLNLTYWDFKPSDFNKYK
ncbi:cilia- and flagella-associated protein 206-like [Diorhabda carinulata]|uniref:cilia- and flagella-associated protein 206-like n=1 Tax=Diorhabda carinulata TaxID=1163345 RepID=UPI0025A10DBC|nr:cilia- and flagella-associated protein 206-like [Diorhabda carinulata]